MYNKHTYYCQKILKNVWHTYFWHYSACSLLRPNGLIYSRTAIVFLTMWFWLHFPFWKEYLSWELFIVSNSSSNVTDSWKATRSITVLTIKGTNNSPVIFTLPFSWGISHFHFVFTKTPESNIGSLQDFVSFSII